MSELENNVNVEEEVYITLTFDDGTEENCMVIGIFEADDKEYIATVQFGANTDTYDLEGVITYESNKKVVQTDVETALKNFEGEIYQVPPIYSALKVNGKKLYDYARQGQKVDILNINNGERFQTYILAGKRGNKDFCLNGAAARKAQIGDKIIICSYALMTPEEAKTFKPTIVQIDDTNSVI